MEEEILQLWDPPELRPSYVIAWYGDDGVEDVEEGDLLTQDEVFCDLCNEYVPIRPVPVLFGTYALCVECLSRYVPDWEDRVDKAVLASWEKQLAEWEE